MSFEFEVDVPTEDGKGTETLTFHLKDPKDIPVGILRRNRYNELGLTFAAMEWALDPDEVEDFDRLTMAEVEKMSQAWQKSDLAEAEPKPNRATRRKTKTPAPDDDED